MPHGSRALNVLIVDESQKKEEAFLAPHSVEGSASELETCHDLLFAALNSPAQGDQSTRTWDQQYRSADPQAVALRTYADALLSVLGKLAGLLRGLP